MEKLETINIHPDEVVKQYKELLKNSNLPLMQRKQYETYIQNYEFHKKPVQEQKKLIGSKVTNKKTLTPQRIVISAAFAALVATGTLKLYNNAMEKATFQGYDKIYTNYEVKYGDSLSTIASNYYEQYPDDIKEYLDLNELVKEIISINHIKNPDNIKEGTKIIIPNEYRSKTTIAEDINYSK